MSYARLSRRVALALGLSVVAFLVVSAPMLALANNSDNAAGGNSASAPGQTGDAGNSGEAPGQANTEAVVETVVEETTPEPPPGNSGSAPGQNKSDTSSSGAPPTSNAGGNSDNSNAGGSKDSTASAGSDTPGSHGVKSPTSPKGNGKGDGPTSGAGGNNCDGDPSGGSNTGKGANTSGDFDNTCDDSPSGPAPNGNGNGGSKGKPCAGCVGNADDKNPPGQSHRPEDKNKGYECDGNKGVGKGNPAHTGCEPITNNDCTSWSLSVTVTNGTPSISGFTNATSLPTNVTITATADEGYNTTGLPGGSTTRTLGTTAFSSSVCSQSFSYSFQRIQTGDECESWGLTATVVNGTITAPSEMIDGSHEFSTDTPQSVTFTAASGFSDDGTATGQTTVTKTAGAYSAFPLCDASVSMAFSEIGGEIVDCDDDGIPDGVDPDISECEPDEPEEPELCPDGLPPDEDGQCVRGIIITRPDDDEDPVFPDVAGKNLGAPDASVLPFTGGNLLPFLMLSVGLVATGSAATLKRRKIARV